MPAGAAGAGFVLRYGGNEAELPLGLIIGGCATALGALLFTLIIALVTRPWTK